MRDERRRVLEFVLMALFAASTASQATEPSNMNRYERLKFYTAGVALVTGMAGPCSISTDRAEADLAALKAHFKLSKKQEIELATVSVKTIAMGFGLTRDGVDQANCELASQALVQATAELEREMELLRSTARTPPARD